MNILGALRIPHSVLCDLDGGTPRSRALQKAIDQARNAFTRIVDYFPNDLETFLGIPPCGRKDRKPQYMMWQLNAGKIAEERLRALAEKIQPLLDD
jgi:hypothetical protein